VKKEIPAAEKMAEPAAQLSFFEDSEDVKKPSISSKEKKIIDKVKALDILDMTPMQALNTLYELHRKLKN
jgi:DNA mismatch repair protein MutS